MGQADTQDESRCLEGVGTGARAALPPSLPDSSVNLLLILKKVLLTNGFIEMQFIYHGVCPPSVRLLLLVFLSKLRCFRHVLTQAAVQGVRSEWCARLLEGCQLGGAGGHDLEFGELPFWVVPAHVF